jgi:hypothetical protein
MMTDERLKQLDSVMITNDRTAEIAIDECVLEIHRLRADLAAMTEQLDLANRRLGELAHAPIMDELNMLRKFFNDYGFNELAEAKRELARYKTPNVDNCVCHETSTRNCSVNQNGGGR